MSKERWFNKLFIDEAKPALNRHSGSGGEKTRSIKTYLEAGGTFQSKDVEDYRPLLEYDDTENVSLKMLFYQSKAKYVPSLNAKGSDSIQVMFAGCSNLIEVPFLDTAHILSVQQFVDGCSLLEVIPAYDFRKVIYTNNIFRNCSNLKEIWIKNIPNTIQVASGDTYGHLLTVDSLVHLIQELIPPSLRQQTLTIGEINREKLTNVHIRLIEITDAMRAEDDLIDQKLPFEVCESTDEGAIPIIDYANSKNWNIA